MKILISVIAYNEEENIQNVLNDLKAHNFGYDIIVIDNASTDGTREVCKKLGVKYVHHCVNSGGSSGTILTYFLYAEKNNYDIVCQFDGDGQHLAKELPKIINPIIDKKADIVIGSRFLEKKGFQSHFFRRIGIRVFAFLHFVLTRQVYKDVTSGFRSYNKKTIDIFGAKFKNDLFDGINQFLLISHYSKLKTIEVPVIMKKREFGQSEFNLWSSIFFPLKGLAAFIGCFLQRNEIAKMNVGL